MWTNGQINRFKQNERYRSYLVPYGKEKNQEVILGLDKFEEEGKNVKLSYLIIDVFRRYACLCPMKNKNSDNVLKNLEAAFKVMGEPIEILTDEEAALLWICE